MYSYTHLLFQSIFWRCSSLGRTHKNVWMRMLSQRAIKVVLSAVYHNSNQGPRYSKAVIWDWSLAMRYFSSGTETALEENYFWIDSLRVILQYSLPRNRNSSGDKTSYLARLLCKKSAVVASCFKKISSETKCCIPHKASGILWWFFFFFCTFSLVLLRLSEKHSLKGELHLNKLQTSYTRLSSLLQSC